MTSKCIQGHAIADSHDTGEQSHPPQNQGLNGAAAFLAPTISLTPQQLQDLVQGAIAGCIGCPATNSSFELCTC